ncbi:MAG: flagellar M-ring protein FliF [Candidatus Omnitrophota bacterium]|jgi:flagellar M-ring protein FliF|nr:MAG: flagellar M-ring protein FliF [Candidatus Omnitrophota bacterium]
MGDFIEKLREQLTRIWESLPIQQKIILIAGPSVLLIAMIVAVYLVSRPQMVTLLSSSDQVQLNEVATFLDNQNIAYKTEGNSILVNAHVKNRVAMQLAGEGIIGFRSGPGYELFDQVRLGMTKRMFDVNYIRAKQNELSKVIVSGARNIESAHVELNIPQEALFKEDEVEPSATVKVVTRGGVSPQEVEGIQRLVAFAVERLRPEKVVVLDGSNRTLSKESDEEPGVAEAKKHFEIEQTIEKKFKANLEGLLEKLVGPKGYDVRVNLKCNWQKKRIKNIHYDATNPATVSAKNYTETTEEQGISGEPGVTSNVQDTGIGAEPGSSKTAIEETIENFIHPWFETMIEEEQGELQELSVTVLVDYTKDADGNPTPRDEDQMTQFEKMLKNAAGLPSLMSAADTSKYSFIIGQQSFDKSYEQALARELFWNNVMTIVKSMIPLILLFALGYFAYIFFQRAFRPAEVEEESLEEEIPIEPVTEAKELTLAQLGLSEFGDIASLPAEEQRRLKMQEHVINYAAEKPEEVAGIIKAWLTN